MRRGPSSTIEMLKPPKGFDAGGVLPLVWSLMCSSSYHGFDTPGGYAVGRGALGASADAGHSRKRPKLRDDVAADEVERVRVGQAAHGR